MKWHHKSKVCYTKDILQEIFGPYGRIEEIAINSDKRRAYVIFAYKASALQVLADGQRLEGEFHVRAVDRIEEGLLGKRLGPEDAVLSTDALNRMRMANEKRSYDTMKGESGKKKEAKKVDSELTAEDFKRKEEEILKKLLE